MSQIKPDNPSAKGPEREGAEKKDKERDQMMEQAREFFPRFLKRYKELLAQRVNLAQLTEQISYPLYDKYYTEEELKDLIAFYKTPTGRKAIKVMPELMQESMQRWGELLNPTLIQIVGEIMQDETARMLKK